MNLSIIIPACNEGSYIGACLSAVLASTGPQDAQVIIAANGCTDETVAQAQAFGDAFEGKGWRLAVLDLPALGKHGAMDAGDAAAAHACRVYLDADVLVSPTVLAEVAQALSVPEARYVSGTPIVTAQSWITRAYARFWVKLPFVAQGVPGFGLYAVNEAGRARWGQFPAIISDDTFVRVQFTPVERVKVPGTYRWPMVEGFRQLVRVRRRQDQGVAEMAALHPDLMANEGKARTSRGWLLGRLMRDPIAFVTYAAVTVAVGAGWGAQVGWVRGR
jgi:glycosyltransferase involved in cell wall biosynthesis